MVKFYMIFLLCGIFTEVTQVLSQVTYTIGVQEILNNFNNSGLNLPANVNVISVTVNNAPTITALSNETQRLFGLGIDYLIYTYQQTASLVTNNMYPSFNKTVPYLIVPSIPNDPILGLNAVYIQDQEAMAMDATRALLSYLNISVIVYIDFALQSTANNLVAFKSYTQTLVTVTNVTQIPSTLQVIFQNNVQNTYVCAIPFNETDLINLILTEAMFKGQLNPGKVWIFNKVTSDTSNFNVFKQFYQVAANIYSFGVNYATNLTITSLSLFQQSITRDYLRFIMQSINGSSAKSANASAQLMNTLLPNGELLINAGINASTRQFNGTVINVLQVNTAQTPLQKFTYNGQLVEFNASGIVRSLNYSTVTVRIGVVLSKAYFMQNPNNTYYGYSVSVLNALQQLSNFKFVYVFPNDNLTGEVVTINGSTTVYNGIISLINQGLVDMSIIPMNPMNIGNMTFQSDVILQTKISLLTREPDQVLFYTLIFVPFAYNVWLGIALIILIMTFAFWSINKISPNISKKGTEANLESYTFIYSFLIIYSSFVTAKLKIRPRQISLHIFAFILWFSTLTFVITYTCNMIAYMISPSIKYPFSKASSLYQNSTFNWSFVKNSIDASIAQNDPILGPLYNISMNNWPNTAFINDSNSESILSMNKYILIQDDNKNGYIYNRYCISDKFPARDIQYSLIFPMNPSWPQRIEMKRLIAQLINSGTMTALSNRYFTLGKCARGSDGIVPVPKVLTLLTTISLFLIPLAGIVFGLLFVILILFKEKIQRCIKYSKLNKFVYGEQYDAKISSLEKDGVWAFINDRDRPYFISNTSLHPDLRKTYTANELNIQSGDVIKLKYFGKDPVNGYKRFCKDKEE